VPLKNLTVVNRQRKEVLVANNQIRIYPRLRPVVDAERLAAALLDLVDHLNAEDRREFIAEGERALKEVKGKTMPKGSAA